MGPGPHPLYAIYHPPLDRGLGGKGIVLCNALGSESNRSHRSFRVLADSLARSGWHVLRFDYRGTGDSSGDENAAQMGDWIEDIGSAVDELCAIADLPGAHLLGLRLGAHLATAVALERSDIQGLILWDPVENEPNGTNPPLWNGSVDQPVPADLGGTLSTTEFERMLIQRERFITASGWPAQALVIGSGSIPRPFSEILNRRIDRLQIKEVSEPPPWLEESDFGAGPVAANGIRSIASWTGEGS